MKKYELTDETKKTFGHTIHRIRALRDFGNVRKGDLGGWVERERNLSQTGNAWVYGNAEVYGTAKVSGNAKVSDNAWVFGNAKVFGDAKVYGTAWVFGDAKVYDNAWIYGDAKVSDNARVFDNAEVFGTAWVSGTAWVCGDAHIVTNADYAVYKNTWSSGRWFTYTRSNKKWVVGCFYGTGDKLVKKAYADSELSGKCYKAIVEAQERIDKAIKEANKND